ncbi:MAG: hydantoinase B/oxoprolinase family protein [Hyphomicrobiales bacterium]|nr:hydantoinase B/oxoprolinase family protein [Hyphomicrobiales bacterium]
MGSDGGWRFAVDRGGTFTDVIGYAPDGSVHVRKLLSQSDRYEDAAAAGVRELLGAAPGQPLDLGRVESVRLGTTVATNALLERNGEPTLLLTTVGFGDALEIGHQARPKIFALRIEKPAPLYAKVAEAPERVRADGTVERPLDEDAVRAALGSAYADGLRAVAIAVMHGYAYPAHERRAAEIAAEVGFTQISLSSEVSPLIKFIPRAETAVADAYLSPVVRRYVGRVKAALGVDEAGVPAPELLFMQSSGGLAAADAFHGRDAVLSGPAGGVIAAVEAGRAAGFDRIIAFDMGGTSTDVAHYAGEYERSLETEAAGVRLRSPMLRVHTVAAGGGSLLAYDGARLRVGPQSAGAAPGPACYGRGGPLAVTDANLVTGKLSARHFPRAFGESGLEPLDEGAARASFDRLARAMNVAPERAADGFLQVAAENMANAIRKITVERGYDVAKYALVAFGGAAGQHACLVAERLGVERILIHPLSGVLSAHGIGLADETAVRARSLEQLLSAESLAAAEAMRRELLAECDAALAGRGPRREIARLNLKYEGAGYALPARFASPAEVRAAFEDAHRARFGFASPEKQVVIESVEAEARCASPAAPSALRAPADAPAPAGESTRFFTGGAWRDAALYTRAQLSPGQSVGSPAIIVEPHQTVVVEPGWSALITERDELLLWRSGGAERVSLGVAEEACSPDPALLEVMQNRFMAIAEQMGAALASTAQSVNIRERLDFSCGVFDACGDLVANAPHIPVHLGSMDAAVQAVIRAAGGELREGDAYMLNAPYEGGTHLPDITVVSPVFADGAPEFYVAARGHHADIGGAAPGSITPSARTIEEEGVYIPVRKLTHGGAFLEADVRALLAGARHPARNPDANIADLKAQVAANARGAEQLRAMADEFGLDAVRAYMAHAQDYGERCVREAIGALTDGAFQVETDQGARICVAVRVNHAERSAEIDFTGTSAERDDNFNAPEPIARAAVLYVFRTLVDGDMPINAGCLRPLRLVIPDGCMLKPRWPAAVVAGNVETSQVIVNALYGALGRLGSAQGTMNNLTFGDDRVQYYETICSGAPAGPGFDGAAAVQTHMTNSRLTDPEVLEARFPALVERFAIRRGSGGLGRWRAGDGVERVIRFLAPLKCAIISGFRTARPHGTAGGEAGQRGENLIRRAHGRIEPLGGCAETQMRAGDAIVIRTPTGGGYGALTLASGVASDDAEG